MNLVEKPGESIFKILSCDSDAAPFHPIGYQPYRKIEGNVHLSEAIGRTLRLLDLPGVHGADSV